MKNIRLYFILLSFSSLLPSSFSQNWPTVGGNNQRNGQSRMPGPTSIGVPVWTVQSGHNTAWGNAVYISGERFVNTRVQISPNYVAQIECRSLADGALLWEKSIAGQILYAVGFDEHAVYVHNYSTDDFFALRPEDGALLWQHPEPVDMFGGNAGVLFACNGDPVVFGKRIDKNTGETVWATNYTIPIAPDGGFAAYGETYYHWEGSIATPKRLIAVDMNTGLIKYKSAPMGGDPDQENPLTVGPDGTIYITRDGGQLLAFRDTGTGFDSLWASNAAAESRMAAGPDGTLYYFRNNRILRISPLDGHPIDTSTQVVASTSPPLIATDPDGRVYVSNGVFGSGGRYYCFSPDLHQVLWTQQSPTNYYSGPAFGRDGTMVAVGEGTALKAYRFSGDHRPVADFETVSLQVNTGEGLDFQDYSSFSPDSWQWFFSGAVPAFSSDQNPSGIVYDTPGLYDVTLVVSNALGSDTLVKTCYLDVRESSPVEEIAGAKGVRIFPNPASEVVRVEAPEGSWVRVWDVATGTLQWSSERAASIDLREWPPGFYEVDVWDGRLRNQAKLVVIH